MHYHIILTELCNSQCRYCYLRSLEDFESPATQRFTYDFETPEKSSVDVKKLKEFLSRDRDAVLIFYGGEPLMEIEKLKEIMDKINVPFRMQTNGKLLDQLPAPYVNRIGKILVSLDGTKERTDFNRGIGTYKKVMNNVDLIKKNGFSGELIARMALDFPDVCESVKVLVGAGFTSVHWQLTKGFYNCDYDLKKWTEFFERYNKSISELIEYWVSELEKGNLLMFYPFVGIADSLLKGEKTKLRCGAGHSGYAITTNGKIIACPVMNNIDEYVAGDLNSKTLKKFEVPGCNKCEVKDVCGGRCLYWHAAGPIPKDGDILICNSVKHLIKELRRVLPRVRKVVEAGAISLEHERYFGPEIIP